MQIDGAREFFSRITSLNGPSGARSGTLLSALTSKLGNSVSSLDTLAISDIGKRLSIKKTEEISTLADSTDKTADSPEYRYLLKAEQILGKMHEIAVLASDKELNDQKRVDMQIEMEDLRDQLAALHESFAEELSGRAPMKYLKGEDSGTFGENSDSLLERMKIRIMNGQEWNVREALCVDDFVKYTDLNGDGAFDVEEVYSANEYYIVDDQRVYDTYSKERTDIKTVREKLEEGTPFLVMDAESAEKAAESLEQKLQMVMDYRNDMAMGKKSQDPDSVYRFLQTIDSPYRNIDGNIRYGSYLNNPSYFTDSFLHMDGVYNTPYVFRDLTYLDGSDIPLAKAEGAEKNNGGSASDTGYVLDVLSGTEIAALRRNKEPEKIYVHGVVGKFTR